MTCKRNHEPMRPRRHEATRAEVRKGQRRSERADARIGRARRSK